MYTISRRQLVLGSMAASLLPAAMHATAKSDYPDHPVEWMVPYLAGTGPDISARLIAEGVSQHLGQPVVIMNRPGAGGLIGTRSVVKAKADGYTWLYAGSPTASSMRIFKKPGFDAEKDFNYVARLTASDVMLIVRPDSGIETFDDLLKLLRSDPGAINYSSGGVGTPSHLGVELLLSEVDTQAMHVPYKGATELITAVLNGDVTFGMPILSVAYPMVESGKLRALAVSSRARNPKVPDVPTLEELGVDVELDSWGGVAVPAGTPPEVIQTIHQALEKALQNPELIGKLQARGGRIEVLDGKAFSESITNRIAQTEAVMSRIGMKPF